MSSIATKTGDSGQTALVGGERVSKADLRVETYGSVDELGSFLGYARSICTQPDVAAWTETIQRTLFRVGSALSTPIDPARPQPAQVTPEDVAMLTDLVYKIEATEGILSDWSLAGANTQSAAYDIARTVCRRVERLIVRLIEQGTAVEPDVLRYINRLSDLIWLFGRLIEVDAGINASLRKEGQGPNFSKAW